MHFPIMLADMGLAFLITVDAQVSHGFGPISWIQMCRIVSNPIPVGHRQPTKIELSGRLKRKTFPTTAQFG
jgi:hypothetical protein